MNLEVCNIGFACVLEKDAIIDWHRRTVIDMNKIAYNMVMHHSKVNSFPTCLNYLVSVTI